MYLMEWGGELRGWWRKVPGEEEEGASGGAAACLITGRKPVVSGLRPLEIDK